MQPESKCTSVCRFHFIHQPRGTINWRQGHQGSSELLSGRVGAGENGGPDWKKANRREPKQGASGVEQRQLRNEDAGLRGSDVTNEDCRSTKEAMTFRNTRDEKSQTWYTKKCNHLLKKKRKPLSCLRGGDEQLMQLNSLGFV